jgi:hypothetical protein
LDTCGRRAGALSHWHTADLGREVLNAIVDKTQLDANVTIVEKL